jgi:hypothetical protein
MEAVELMAESGREAIESQLRALQATNIDLRRKNIALRRELAETLLELEQTEERVTDAICKAAAIEMRVRLLEAKLGTCEHGYHLGHFIEGNRHCPGAPSVTLKAAT